MSEITVKNWCILQFHDENGTNAVQAHKKRLCRSWSIRIIGEKELKVGSVVFLLEISRRKMFVVVIDKLRRKMMNVSYISFYAREFTGLYFTLRNSTGTQRN